MDSKNFTILIVGASPPLNEKVIAIKTRIIDLVVYVYYLWKYQ